MSRSLFQNIFAASVLAIGVVGCAESLPTDSSDAIDPSGAEEVESSDELAQQFPGFPRRPSGNDSPSTDEPVGTPVQAGSGSLPPVSSLSAKGPFDVTIDQRGGGNTWIFHPTQLGRDGVKHPIFVWGTGATSVPRQYTDHFNLIASHGFVVISPNTGSVNGRLLKQALDWIIQQNSGSGKFAGKLDTSNIAMGGHSLGSVSTFDAEQNENRLKTTIHIAGGSFDGQGSRKVKTPTAYMCGAAGDIALPQCQTDFRNVKSGIPTYYAELQRAGHVDAARVALPAMVGWLRWHLAGETQHKAQFSPGGEFFKGVFKAQVKNWN
ncbi:MAG: hypothetical protein ABW252_22120 [Polyangiales bacterium]